MALAGPVVAPRFNEIFAAEGDERAILGSRTLRRAATPRVLLVADAFRTLEARLLAPVDRHDELIAAAARRVVDDYAVGIARAALVERREALVGACAVDIARSSAAARISAGARERDS